MIIPFIHCRSFPKCLEKKGFSVCSYGRIFKDYIEFQQEQEYLKVLDSTLEASEPLLL